MTKKTVKTLETPYAIDLGNGFSKRMWKDKMSVDPSVFAVYNPTWSDAKVDIFEFEDGDPIIIGNHAKNLVKNVSQAMVSESAERYSSKQFRQLFLSTIAKDLRKSTRIPHLVTGLPVSHFNSRIDQLESFKGEHTFLFNGEKIYIEIENVHVLPQPLGTYFYTIDEDIDTGDSVLVIDVGHGTLDITELNGQAVVTDIGNDLGIKEAHNNVAALLREDFNDRTEFGSIGITEILEKGLKYKGSRISIREKYEKQLRAIFRNHFDLILAFITENKLDLTTYDNVIWTGGGSQELFDFIMNEEGNDNNHYIFIEEPQTANIKGYFAFGQAKEDEFNDTE
ncbi:hypothetical protein ACI2JA_19780 [Alkalihalobacillus sp. NPDC078783]